MTATLITLDAEIVTDSSVSGIDWARVSRAHLHYYCFPGNITFRVGDADFSAPWGWVPVFDFAVTLHAIAEALGGSNDETLEFTESADALRFMLVGDVVEVSATYVEARASVRVSELRRAATAFLEQLASELMVAYPGLAVNEAFIELIGAE